MKKEAKLSDLIIEDFERFKKDTMEKYYKVIQSHTKDYPHLIDNPKYIDITENYKPYWDINK